MISGSRQVVVLAEESVEAIVNLMETKRKGNFAKFFVSSV
jgi:hypothetical protein